MHPSLLQNISQPRDLKRLSSAQIQQLCGEIRQFLLDSVSKTGGHLASNLGAVELTVALHRVFETPQDAFVFDVGHQCYTHKLLTGRYKRFGTLRQLDGLSGMARNRPMMNSQMVGLFMTAFRAFLIPMRAPIMLLSPDTAIRPFLLPSASHGPKS